MKHELRFPPQYHIQTGYRKNFVIFLVHTVYTVCAINIFKKYRKYLWLKVKCKFLSSQNDSREVQIRSPSRLLLIVTVNDGSEPELRIGYYLPS